MYDRHLETFIAVADSGSFTRAAERRFISANAIRKQINLLEDRLGVKLFIRTARGLELTEAGRYIYAESKNLIRSSDNIIRHARVIEGTKRIEIRVGVSLMNPLYVVSERWSRFRNKDRDLELVTVQFRDVFEEAVEIMRTLGKEIDVIPTTLDGAGYESICGVRVITQLPVRVGVPASHPKSEYERLSVSDLSGETFVLANRDTNILTDRIENEVLSRLSGIRIERVNTYDHQFFNKAVACNGFIISNDTWANTHPMMTTKEVDWEYTIPYGLLVAKEPSEAVERFLRDISDESL